MYEEPIDVVLREPELQGLSLVRSVAAGGFGEVFEVRSGAQRFALKLQDSRDPARRERFAREVAALRRLDDPSIVRFFASGQKGASSWLLMEWCEGTSLEQLVEASYARAQAGLDEAWVRERFTEIAYALRSAHSVGVLHRDIKAANILIVKRPEGERACLVDFGLAKLAGEASEKSLTQTGESLGTVETMSPEQIDAKGIYGEMSPATDVWGWGATLYFALTGQDAFARENLVATCAAILSAPTPEVTALRPDVSHDLAELVARCLEKLPEDRITLDELIRQLTSPEEQVEAEGASSALEGSPNRPLFASLVLGLLLCLLLGFALIPSAPPVLRVRPELPTLTRERTLEIEGQLDRAGVELQLGRELFSSEGGGHFRRQITLSHGKNLLELRWRQHLLWSQLVECDLEAPRFSSPSERSIPWPRAGKLLISASDDPLARLRVDGGEPRSLKAGRYELSISPSAKPCDLQLELCDVAGNVTRQRVSVRSPISDLASWRELNDKDQDRIALELSSALGPDFRLRAASIFGKGAARQRLLTISFSIRSKGLDIPMILVPGGTFLMGSPSDEPDRSEREGPQRTVRIAAMLVAQSELTQAQWDALGGKDQRTWRRPDRPIEGVTWPAILDWLERAGGGLHLPSEAEWEYACRAGTQTLYAHGAEVESLPDHAWFSANANRQTQPVMQKRPNGFGLYDMAGNVFERCQDDWHESYLDAPTDHRPWGDGRAAQRATRGGSWRCKASGLRAAFRGADPPDFQSMQIGFRVFRRLD